MTVDQVAAQLGVTTDTVRQWIRSGRMPALNIGTPERPRYRVTDDQLAEFEGRCAVVKMPQSKPQRYRHARY